MTARASQARARDGRAVLLFSLVCLIAIAWVYLLSAAGLATGMREMGGEQTMQMRPAWTPGYATLVFFVWVIMMVAMMLPGAAPTILRVAGLTPEHPAQVRGMPAAMLFTGGYLAAWTGVSIAATLVQWEFDRAGLLSQAASRSAAPGGLIPLAAGLYQLTPLKQRCLEQCRAPLDRLAQDWRMGVRAAVAAGMRYGVLGVGCCGILMGLMFAGGVMNVSWMAGITLLILLEQTPPWGRPASQVAGATLIVWGSVVLTSAIG